MENASVVVDSGSNASSSMAVVEGAASEAEFDVYVYLSNFYGPQRQPAEKLIPLTIVYIGEKRSRERETDSAFNLEGLLLGLAIRCVCALRKFAPQTLKSAQNQLLNTKLTRSTKTPKSA